MNHIISRSAILGVTLLSLAAAGSAQAQGVGINTTGAAADTSAILDLSSTAKGFLPPRMTSVQRAAIVQPATGLLVYQTDGTAGLYYNTGTPAAPNWKQVGDAGSGGASQWTTNGANIHYSAGNVGVQRSSPLARLDVLGGNWDVVNGEGDFRIGDGTTRLKFGVATGGGGTGAATIMEQGPPGAYNVLSLGTQGNKVLHVNGNSQRVGIGIDAPTAPLGFAAVGGKKVSLFPNGASDYGLGIAAGRLQIFSDGTASGDVAIGTDNAGAFTERFAFRNNGALAVGGNTGTTGQVLQSNGSESAPSWVTPASSTKVYRAAGTGAVTVAGGTGSYVPGMEYGLVTAAASNVVVSYSIPLQNTSSSSPTKGTLEFMLWGNYVKRFRYTLAAGATTVASGTFMVQLPAGMHLLNVYGTTDSGQPAIEFGSTFGSYFQGEYVLTVVPQ